MKLIFLFFFTCYSYLCFSEYRVYQYHLKNKIKTANDAPNGYYILSTLNPVSYIAYHGGSKIVNVSLLRTWICPGFTGKGRNYCPSPYDQITEKATP